jgi:RND family efflux transporter MFP subunit
MTYTGWLRASAKVDVRARVRGHIEKVDFRDGDLVKRGQLLFELDPRPFQTQIDQARAQAKAVAAQKVSLQKDVDRYRELIKSKAVSEQQLDQAVADLGYADAQLAAKNEEVKSRMLELEYSKITSPIAGRTGRAMLNQDRRDCRFQL